MCTKLKVAKVYITQGMTLQYRVLSAIKSGSFGFQMTGYVSLNVREDRLTNFWKNFLPNRAVIEAESFVEKGYEFGKVGVPTKIAALHNHKDQVAIITTNSNPMVSAVHYRMPAIIEDTDAWLQDGILKFEDANIQLLGL